MSDVKAKLLYRFARLLAALPGPIQVALSGSAPIELDGQRLAPSQQLSLSMLNRQAAAVTERQDPPQMRLERRRLAAIFGGPPERVASVQDLRIGTIPARHYAPPAAGSGEPAPLLVYFHGGGFVFGDLDTHDSLCRLLCRSSCSHVLAVDYRLAPEHPFPAAVDDARAALAWAFENAERLGADSARVGVGGDSAGGNLSAVVSQMSARDGGPAPVLQLLIYPATDMSTKRRSRELFSEGFFLTDAEMRWFETSYLGPASGTDVMLDPRVSPMLAEDLSGLAPAIVVTAGFDPLRDEGEDYARALQAAGTPALVRRYEGLIHGFVSGAGVSRQLREAVLEIGGMTGGAFAMGGAPAPLRALA
ncbi:MAG TPA: alpha/beta hydrolase [Solirubrobacteraceae bacterium]|nr:alpha/beta hydrolase [Solirubrobacteraceae bacterium]